MAARFILLGAKTLIKPPKTQKWQLAYFTDLSKTKRQLASEAS